MNHLVENYIYKLVRLQLIKLRLKKMKFGYNILILIECNDEKIQFRRNMCDFTQISLFILFQFDSSV